MTTPTLEGGAPGSLLDDHIEPFLKHLVFVNSIWPTLILSFGPPKGPTALLACSVVGDRGRSGALRCVFCGALRAERRLRSPTTRAQKMGAGTRAAGSNS